MDETTIERINLGHASAYAYYKAGGGTGTEEEFTQWMADLGIQVEYLENMAVVTNTLEPGTPASATYEDGVLTLNIPKGEKGDPAPADEVAEATDAWLAQNITNPSNPPLDRSLTLENAAAPADMVGDLRSAIDATQTQIDVPVNIVRSRYINVEGVTTANSKRARTDPLDGSGTISAVNMSGDVYKYYVSYYDETCDISNGTGYDGRSEAGAGRKYIPENAKKIVLTFARMDDAVMTVDDVSAITAALSFYAATDDSFLISGKPADSKATGDRFNAFADELRITNEIVDLKDQIMLPSPTPSVGGSGYIASDGSVGTNASYTHTSYIDISRYKTIRYRRGGLTGTAVQYAAVYNANYEKNRVYRWASDQSEAGYVEELGLITIQDGDVYVRFTKFADTERFGDFYVYAETTPLSDELSGIHDDIAERIEKATEVGVNLFDTSKAVSGYINANGNISSGSSYITSDFIPLANGQTVYANRIRNFMAYNLDKSPISESYESSAKNNFYYTATQDCYIRATLYVDYASANIISYDGKPLYYEPYAEKTVVESGIHLSKEMVADSVPFAGNVLDGKKWVACGDSFTHGDFQRSMTDDYTFTDSPYYGQNKVYPFWIGRRNQGLTVINEAISGSTMTAGESGVNPFSGERYTAVPSDADYITLMFGINDSGNSCPIGTIDDNDNTTFYGAWNVVLNYFITNFPYAHIGIIVGPGMQTSSGQQYANAEIAVAKKWGIPYLNIQFESGGENIPLMLRTSNPDVSQAAKALRNSQQYVNNQEGASNMHPNEKAHEFESTFIEAWLRTL